MQQWCEFALVDVVLEQPPEEEIWWIQGRLVRCPFHFTFGAGVMLLNFFSKVSSDSVSSVRKSTIQLEPLFLLNKVLMLLELSLELLKHWNVMLFCFHLHYSDHQRKMIQWCHALRWWPIPTTFLMLKFLTRPFKKSGLYPKTRHHSRILRHRRSFAKTTGTWLSCFLPGRVSW